MENKNFKQRLEDFEKCYDVLRLEVKVLYDENKSLIIVFWFLNGEIEKENKCFNLYVDEFFGNFV